MKGKTTALVLALSLALLLPLSACGGGLSADDAQLYVQGVLDENYLGKADPDFLKLIDSTEEETEEVYAGSMETEAQFFLDSFVESELSQEEQDRLLEELSAMYRQIYAHSKYTVESASEVDDTTFGVKVTVEPIDIFHQVADELNNGAADELNSRYPDQMTDEEYMAYEVEWVELFMDLTYEKLPQLDYLEPQTLLVQVALGDDDYWTIPDEDFWAVDALVIDYNLG
ncbi:hypothetical protein [Flavonifractor sp. HCP28S3_F3]|uniref:hypothetical protein n=1 Tax=Flavonifractor sp. HCP28S3_F3 TaxID=3438939 RepID=UPI003F8B1EB0